MPESRSNGIITPADLSIRGDLSLDWILVHSPIKPLVPAPNWSR